MRQADYDKLREARGGSRERKPQAQRGRNARVIWLAEPRPLGLHGRTRVVGVMSDAPLELLRAYGVGDA